MDRDDMPSHGTVLPEQVSASTEGEDQAIDNRFGRMFDLEPADHNQSFLRALGAPGGPMDESQAEKSVESSSLSAGIAFLGQYIDHDITLDVRSTLDRTFEPQNLRNFRTPRLDLDSLYGGSREVVRFMYGREGEDVYPRVGAKLLVGTDAFGEERDDLLRNRQGTAIIGDPRNDENLVISQLQLAFVQFHNKVVDILAEEEYSESTEELLEKAQELVRRHFQYLVLEEFLSQICEPDVVESVLDDGREYFTPTKPSEVFIPVEFAGAAYRYGHSQIRQRYTVNDDHEDQLFYGPIENEALGTGFQPVDQDKTIEWKHFFRTTPRESPQRSRKIDPLIPPVLLKLPFVESTPSLAARNLLRGRTYGLPSGQAVADEIGAPILSNEQIGLASFAEKFFSSSKGSNPDLKAPLWYYVLAEAREFHDGDRLGPVGSRIVAETLVGIVEADPSSYRNTEDWTPSLKSRRTSTSPGEFSIADVVTHESLNRAWTYVVQQDDTVHTVRPLTSAEPITEFYGRNGGFAADTTTNVEQAYASQLFLYRGPEQISLGIIHGPGGGLVSMSFTGLPEEGRWIVQDDRPEFKSATDEAIDWGYKPPLTDGGVFRGGLNESFEITVEADFNENANREPETVSEGDPGEIHEWQFLTGSVSAPDRITLDMSRPVTISAQ